MFRPRGQLVQERFVGVGRPVVRCGSASLALRWTHGLESFGFDGSSVGWGQVMDFLLSKPFWEDYLTTNIFGTVLNHQLVLFRVLEALVTCDVEWILVVL